MRNPHSFEIPKVFRHWGKSHRRKRDRTITSTENKGWPPRTAPATTRANIRNAFRSDTRSRALAPKTSNREDERPRDNAQKRPTAQATDRKLSTTAAAPSKKIERTNVQTPCRVRQSARRRIQSCRGRRDRSRSWRKPRIRPNSRPKGSIAHDYRPGLEARQLISDIRDGIPGAIRDRDEFAKIDIRAIVNTARELARFGIDTCSALRTTRVGQRNHFIADAEKTYGPKWLKLTRSLSAMFPRIRRDVCVGAPSRRSSLTRPDAPGAYRTSPINYRRYMGRPGRCESWLTPCLKQSLAARPTRSHFSLT